MNKNPILVTGIHRSGSTFMGKMLSLNNNIGYIQEPFNKEYGLRIIDTNFKYITSRTIGPKLKESIDDLLQLKAAEYQIPSLVHMHQNVENRTVLFNELLHNFGPKNVIEFFKRGIFKSKGQLYFYIAKYNPAINRLLIKDPLACFASRYLHHAYNMQVVILVRHPLSFAASLKRINWGFNFDTFLRQPTLMNDYLNKYRKKMQKLNGPESTIVEKAGLLWNCIYTVLSAYIEKNPSFIVCRHEEVATQPIRTFKNLYSKLDLEYTPKVEKKIANHTSRDNPVSPKNNQVHQLNRDSARIIHKWKDILTDDEISYIENETEAVANNFYNPDFFEQL